MRSPSSAPPLPMANRLLLVQDFLVSPLDRPRFTLLFVLATELSSFLVKFILQTLQNPALPASWQEGGLASALVSGLVSGLMIGTTQWLVLRRYVPDWLWILATTAGYVILMPILQAWQHLMLNQVFPTFSTSAFVNLLPEPVMMILPGLLGVVLATVSTLWLGLAQWLILRQYTRSGWQWIYVPSIAVFVSGCVVLIRLMIPALTRVPLAMDILTPGILGTIQAIAFCSLAKLPRRMASAGQSPQLVKPTLHSSRKLHQLQKHLIAQLNQTWKGEQLADRPLAYRVSLDNSSTVVDYAPQQSLAADYAEQTPLPDLVALEIDRPADLSALAQFQVTFLPSGQLKVQACQGIARWKLAIAFLMAVVAVSAIVGAAGLQFPDPN